MTLGVGLGDASGDAPGDAAAEGLAAGDEVADAPGDALTGVSAAVNLKPLRTSLSTSLILVIESAPLATKVRV